MSRPPSVPSVGRTRRLLVPEVVQTSSMDCGPAALKSLLEGFGISVNYERLRDACHTEIDGTSIDTVETIASDFGLAAEQIMLPPDHVLSGKASVLPAVAVVNSPMGGAHFIVVWRRLGGSVQVMDPASGRQWRSAGSLLDSLYIHTALVSAEAWRQWAATPDFLNPLRGRLRRLGLSQQEREQLLSIALDDRSWHGLATLDAAIRIVTVLRGRDSLSARDGVAMLNALLAEGQGSDGSAIPERFWFARPATPDASGSERLSLRGAVLVRVSHATSGNSASRESESVQLPPGLGRSLREPSARPVRQVLGLLRNDGLLGTFVWAAALAIAVASVLFEAALLRGLLDVSLYLRTVEQSVAAGGVLVIFAILLLLLEFGLATAEKRVGRQLETRLRVAFLSKIPLLGEAFFRTRPISDMAERGHSLHVLRDLPALGVRTLRLGLELVVTTAAIAWLAPSAGLLALCAAVLAAGIPLLGHSMLAERDLRVRTHAGALSRFQLDALLGRTAIDAHGARPTLEREHEHLLREWIRSSIALHRGSLALEGVQMLVGFGLVGWIVFSHVGTGSPGATLLLAYWVLNLPALGFELSLYAREYPAYRSVLLRLLEPLNAPDAAPFDEVSTPRASERLSKPPIRIDAVGVGFQLSGQDVLDDVTLHIEPGSHVAIVGPSGAGKSTLLSLALGWQPPTTGGFLIDGIPLTPRTAEALRRETACVDPTIQLWNRSLMENLRYGSGEHGPIAPVLEAAGLVPVIAKLPAGLATLLGEGGALLSAGEAQRVRLARAMLVPNPRLVILDEPFMGLERDRRRVLLAEIRQRWAACTVLYVTHEISEARSFDRVLVMERGRLVEDGDPRLLMLMASSRYRRLLQAQESVHARLYSSAEWRRVRLEDGRIVQDTGSASIEQTA
ncbi:MAG: ATP-binding cassette domain-containing protein [Vicinamibacterales bacterium]